MSEEIIQQIEILSSRISKIENTMTNIKDHFNRLKDLINKKEEEQPKLIDTVICCEDDIILACGKEYLYRFGQIGYLDLITYKWANKIEITYKGIIGKTNFLLLRRVISYLVIANYVAHSNIHDNWVMIKKP